MAKLIDEQLPSPKPFFPTLIQKDPAGKSIIPGKVFRENPATWKTLAGVHFANGSDISSETGEIEGLETSRVSFCLRNSLFAIVPPRTRIYNESRNHMYSLVKIYRW